MHKKDKKNNSNPTPKNAGKHYTDEEVLELVQESMKPGARRPENLERLAAIYGRSPGGVDMVMRWGQGGNFPPRANNRIRRQVIAARKRLGLID